MRERFRRSIYFLLLISIGLLFGGCMNSVEDADSSSETADPTKEQVPRHEEILEDMSMEEKVGQLFLARRPSEEAVSYAQDYNLGGYVNFAEDFEEKNPEMVQKEITAIQEEADIEMFMAVDEEGGAVTRVSSFPQYRDEPFPTPREAFEQNGWEGVENIEREKAKLLKDLGINMNLAPVADVPTQPEDYIYERSFSTDPAEVADFVQRTVSIYNDENMGSVLKHFPGYGNNVDTHMGIAYDERPMETFRERDFIPFEAGIEEGTDGILVSHNVIHSVDPDVPASLSPDVIQTLRESLGFDGLIITDDLVMEGLQQFVEPEEAAVRAVEAGNDLLISSEFTVQLPAVIRAVEEGRISEERINESVSRILQKKLELNIIE